MESTILRKKLEAIEQTANQMIKETYRIEGAATAEFTENSLLRMKSMNQAMVDHIESIIVNLQREINELAVVIMKLKASRKK